MFSEPFFTAQNERVFFPMQNSGLFPSVKPELQQSQATHPANSKSNKFHSLFQYLHCRDLGVYGLLFQSRKQLALQGPWLPDRSPVTDCLGSLASSVMDGC